MSDGKHSTAVRAEVAEIDARLRQMEESTKQLERLRNDPEVRRRLDDYRRDYGEGDPSWWKPEFELSDAVASEQVDYAFSAAPKPFVDLSDTIASVVIRSSEEELEQLSNETGIAMTDFQALKNDGSQSSHVAFQVARKVHAVNRACGQYGLDREEFEELPTGPADRSTGTLVGRRDGPVARKYHAASQGVTGTAKLPVPAEVIDSQTPAPGYESDAAEPPLNRQGTRLLWAVLLSVVVVLVVLLVLFNDESEPESQPASAPSSAQTQPAPPSPSTATREPAPASPTVKPSAAPSSLLPETHPRSAPRVPAKPSPSPPSPQVEPSASSPPTPTPAPSPTEAPIPFE